MVNEAVKTYKNSLNFVKGMAEICGKPAIFFKAIYGKVTTPPSGHVPNNKSIFSSPELCSG